MISCNVRRGFRGQRSMISRPSGAPQVRGPLELLVELVRARHAGNRKNWRTRIRTSGSATIGRKSAIAESGRKLPKVTKITRTAQRRPTTSERRGRRGSSRRVRAVRWLKGSFGDDVVHARVDLDETACHVHAVIFPRVTKTLERCGTQMMLQPPIHPLIKDYEKAQDSVGTAFADLGLKRVRKTPRSAGRSRPLSIGCRPSASTRRPGAAAAICWRRCRRRQPRSRPARSRSEFARRRRTPRKMLSVRCLPIRRPNPQGGRGADGRRRGAPGGARHLRQRAGGRAGGIPQARRNGGGRGAAPSGRRLLTTG